MQKFTLRSLLVASLGLALSACNNEAELAVTPESATPSYVASPQDLAFDESLFPKTDRSYSMNNSPTVNFNTLLKKVNPQRLLDGKDLGITPEQEVEIKAAAEQILSARQPLRTGLDTLRTLNTWCHDSIEYKHSNNNAYQCFVNRKAICYGISNLLRAMLLTQGYPTINVLGDLVGAGAHAWSYVKVGKEWYVADPTNNGLFKMSDTGSYAHLVARQANMVLFADENFEYDYFESQLNIATVLSNDERLVVPYSVEGLRVTMFNPHSALPESVRHLYFGQNIRSIGEYIQGLSQYPAAEERIFVDPKNSQLISYEGILYTKNGRTPSSILHVPMGMKIAKLYPLPTLGKNVIAHREQLEEIIIQPGTKTVENYAFEKLPNLRQLYYPEDCTLAEQALYYCAENVNHNVGNFTAIRRVKL